MKFVIIALSGIALILNASPAFARNWPNEGHDVGVHYKWDWNCDFNGRDIRCQTGVGDCFLMCFNNFDCTHFTQLGDRCCIKNSGSFYETHTGNNDQICGFIPGRSDQSTVNRLLA